MPHLSRLILGFAALTLTLAAVAWSAGWLSPQQKLPGRLVSYKQVYDGNWELVCDTATDGSDTSCYVQYVEVYRPRPEFAAAMVEIVMHDTDGQPDPHLRFDIEPGLSFADVTTTLRTPDGAQPLDLTHCRSNTCTLTGDDSRAILTQWRDATALDLTIEEGRDTPAQLSWPMPSMASLLDDFAAQRAARDLP